MNHLVYLCEDAGIPLDGSKGSSIHARSMIQALTRSGARVTVMSPRVGTLAQMLNGDLHVHRMERDALAGKLEHPHRPRGWQYTAEVLAEINAAQPVTAVYERLSLWAAGGSQWCSLQGVPHGLEVNAPLVDEARQHRALVDATEAGETEREILRKADLLFPVSPWLADWLRASGCHPQRIELLPNAVDAGWLVEPTPAPVAPARPNPSAQPMRLGFVGSLRPWHDLPTVLEALALLRSTTFHLTIVGDGPQRAELEAHSITLGLQDRVTFTGAVPHQQIPALIDAMDLCLAPYAAGDNCYFCPIKIYEYGARCRAVLTAARPEIERQFPEGSVFTYDAGDASALATRLVELAGATARVQQAAQALRAHVAAHTWDAHAQRVLAMIQGLPRRSGERVR